jgi:hypothetical protein
VAGETDASSTCFCVLLAQSTHILFSVICNVSHAKLVKAFDGTGELFSFLMEYQVPVPGSWLIAKGAQYD